MLIYMILSSAICLILHNNFKVFPMLQWPYENPAGLSLSICLLYLPAMNAIKMNKHICLIISLLTLVVLLFTQSRTGLCVAYIIAIAYIFLYLQGIVIKCFILMALTSFTLLFVLTEKKASTEGRSFILQTTLQLIMESPVNGFGNDGFQKEYMKRQGLFFKSHPESDVSILADDINHPLSEYVIAWVNEGVCGFLLLFIFTVYPFIYHLLQHHWIHALENIPLFVFCSLSYPLNYPISWLFLFVSYFRIISQKKQINEYVFLFIICFMITHSAKLALMDIGLIENADYLYNKAYICFRKGQFEESYLYAKKCNDHLSSYNLELLSGDICRMTSKFEEAKEHYKTASWMCPSRYAPLEGLFLIGEQKKDSLLMKETALSILKKHIKIMDNNVLRIRKNAEEFIKNSNQ